MTTGTRYNILIRLNGMMIYLCELGKGLLMTRITQSTLFTDDHSLKATAVRSMAAKTIVLQFGSGVEMNLGKLPSLLPVAAKTQLSSLRYQSILIIRSMGIMASYTLPG